MEKVIPPGLNYADYKPEAIENQIRMIKFLPVSNVQNQIPNDVVRFQLQGNGFFDPYSAYIKIQVEIPNNTITDPTQANQLSGKFIDRSAHSFINRLVIRSQGTELERIEQYDVLAAMINDVIYSREQLSLHTYEGFGSKRGKGSTFCDIGAAALQPITVAPLLIRGAPDPLDAIYGDVGAFKLRYDDLNAQANGSAAIATMQPLAKAPIGLDATGLPVNAGRLPASSIAGIVANGVGDATIGLGPTNANVQLFTSPNLFEFCIPIYSGIIGVLQPDKKLLPLSLLPLEVEFTLNPQALYPVGNCTERSYIVKRFEIWTHTLFFEQELHRALESVVASNGIYINYKSFYLTPINTYNTQLIPNYHQLGCFLKSVEALHWVFLYQQYLADNGARKLTFASHSIYNVQLRNGMDLIPSEPIPVYANRTNLGAGALVGGYSQIFIETLKAWNKMHDPLSDAIFTMYNYNVDGCYTMAGDNLAANVIYKPATLNDYITSQMNLGRCQYGLSLTGEEIGQNQTMVSGKKTVLPFDLNFNGIKSLNQTSIMLCYLRADFIIYVRPDLIVTRLGL